MSSVVIGATQECSQSAYFELASRDTGLANDRLKCTDANFYVIRYWYGYGRIFQLFLHDDVTSTLADLAKTMQQQDGQNLLAGQNPQFTQLQPPIG